MVCIDYPRPELDNTVNYLEAAYFSSSFQTAPRPNKPLEIVIAGAGEVFIFNSILFVSGIHSFIPYETIPVSFEFTNSISYSL